jgi:hypothetical protein
MKTVKFLICLLIVFSAITTNAQIMSAQSGSWGEASTWSFGTLPTSSDDVIIGADHVISIDDTLAVCRSLSFVDTSSHIDMNENSLLSIYGDFSIFSDNHNVFSAGWSGNNAKIKFTGEADQLIKNFRHLGPSTAFRDVVIDKPAGVVQTDTSKLQSIGIQNSLEIINGEFILSSQDDIEGRFASSTNLGSTPSITVYPNGIFTMVGSTSHIRKNTNNEAIGKFTIAGVATVTTSSSNRINFSEVEIQEGGRLNITTGWSSSRFSPGVLTIKQGGLLRNSTTTSFWVDSAVVVMEEGGTYETSSSTTVFPPNFQNNGTVRYMRNTSASDQTITDMDYHRLEFSFANSNTKKNWLLAANRTITDSLEINNSAELVIAAPSVATVTVNGTLRLTSGLINNSDPNANIKLGDSVEVSRATGQITNPPIFGNSVNLKYTSSVASVTTGPEFPTTDILNNLTIFSTDQVVTLGTNAKVNGSLTLSAGTFDNNGENNDLVFTIADGSTIRRAAGLFSVRPAFQNKVNLEFISTVHHVTTDLEVPDQASVLNNFTVTGDQGVTLGSNLYVNGELKLTGSELETDEFMVILNNTATLDESAGKTVLGYVQANRNVAQSVMENFGGIGLEVMAQSAAPGITEVLRINNIRTDVFGGRRHFKINPANNTGLNADIKYYYADSEIAHLNEGNLVLYKSTDDGANWTKEGGVINVNDNYVTLSGVNSFSLWSINDKDTPIVNIDHSDISVPAQFSLMQNYPNPFNPTTTLEFTLSNSGRSTLKIYNALGQEMKTLFDEEATAGNVYRISFNASGLPSGIYFAKLVQGSNQMIKKMILVK